MTSDDERDLFLGVYDALMFMTLHCHGGWIASCVAVSSSENVGQHHAFPHVIL